MRPEKSGNQEFFFATDPNRQILKRPLYFHHIPKTGGTSIRFAARAWLWQQDAGEIIAPRFERELKAAGDWPEGVIRFFRAAQALAKIEAVMGHYTAVLASVLQEPIIAIIREPTEQLASNLTFRPNRLDDLGDAVLDDPRINNAQMRSLTMLDIPRDAPGGAELTYWEGVVDETVSRFALFPYQRRHTLLQHLKVAFGLEIIEEGRHKPRIDDRKVSLIVDRLMERAERRDPVWLDRILFKKVSQADD